MLYFTWLDKNNFYNSFNIQKQENSILTSKFNQLKKKIKEQKNQIEKLKNNINNKQKAIKIILPKNDIDYTKIIPKEDYSFIDKNDSKIVNDNDIKIIPSITFDKEKKEIDSFQINIKTKF